MLIGVVLAFLVGAILVSFDLLLNKNKEYDAHRCRLDSTLGDPEHLRTVL